eukprot:SAG31_NODE_48037_length_199_cov_167.890000_1_plen_20_part_01
MKMVIRRYDLGSLVRSRMVP